MKKDKRRKIYYIIEQIETEDGKWLASVWHYDTEDSQ